MKGKQESRNPPTGSRSASDRDWERRLLWVLATAVFALLAYFYIASQTDRKLQEYILAALRERYPTLLVSLDRAHLENQSSLVLDGLRIAVVTTEGPRSILKCQRIVAHGKLEWDKLLRGEIAIDRVDVEGAELSLWPMDSGRWSSSLLMNQGQLSAKLPKMNIVQGLVRIGQQSKQASELILHDLNLSINAKSLAQHAAPSEMLEVEGSAASSYFRELKLSAQANYDLSRWSLSGVCNGIQYSEGLAIFIPQLNGELDSVARGLRCESDLQFYATQSPAQSLNCQIGGKIRKGRFEHPELRYLLEDVEGEFAFADRTLQFRNFQARNGASRFFCDADLFLLAASPTGLARAAVRDLQLDERLRASLPMPLQNHWNNFQPSGSIDADIELRLEGGKWIPKMEIACQDVSIEHTVFPVRMRQVTGRLQFDGERLIAKGMSATLRGQTLRADVLLEKAEPKWAMDLTMYSEGPISIQEDILAALSPRNEPDTRLEAFVRSLQPSGSVQLDRARFIRRKDNLMHVDRAIELSFYDGTVRYDRFRYPIFEIQGRVVVDNGWIQIQNLHGRNDSGRIHCDGNCLCVPEGVEQLNLQFDGYAIPLEEELHRALQRQVADLWDQLQPSGILDRVRVDLRKKSAAEELDVQVVIQTGGADQRPSASSVSIRPKILPIPLDDIRCHLVYRPERLNVLQMSGSRGNSRVNVEGSCRLHPHGAWEANVTWLPGSRVVVDQALISNLPASLQEPCSNSGYRGPISVTGWTHFVNDSVAAHPHVRAWELRMEIEDGQIADGKLIRGIRGTVTMEGESLGDAPTATGTIDLDSMAVYQVPLLGIRGPIAIRNGQILLGRDAHQVVLDRKQPINLVDSRIRFGSIIPAVATADLNMQAGHSQWQHQENLDPPSLSYEFQSASNNGYLERQRGPASDIVAKFGGGRLNVHGIGQLQSGRLNLEMRLDGSNFKELLHELNQPAPNVTGRLDAHVQLSGSASNINTLNGKGRVEIRDAQLYELPWMARLLRLLSVRSPDDSAFESADIEFRLDGDRIPLERISLDGDIISLRGNGWTNLGKELHLDLYTYVGKKGVLAAIMGPIVNHRDATFMYIEVDGTIDQFAIQKKVPMLESTLEQVFPEQAKLGANERKNIR